MIDALRTPDERFANLVEYPFQPKYLQELPGYDGLRMHYLDEGSKEAEHTYLCLHGEPTWSYLYRKMIPIFVQSGGRVIAPDFFGFGRSDKPIDDDVYTFDFHRNSLLHLIARLNLKNVTLVVQDWGGLLGLTLPLDTPETFSRLILMNTGFGTGQMNEAFYRWREFNNRYPDLRVDDLMMKWTNGMPPEVAKGYIAPFPSIEFKGGVRRFPNLVPDNPDHPSAVLSKKAVHWWRENWTHRPVFMAIGMQDPILGPTVMNVIRERVFPHCPPPLEIEEAGHFVQEWGDLVATKALESI